jgi:hypothetical protein
MSVFLLRTIPLTVVESLIIGCKRTKKKLLIKKEIKKRSMIKFKRNLLVIVFFVFTLFNNPESRYADDVDLLGDTIDTIKINTETLIDISKEHGVEVDVYAWTILKWT